MYTLITGGAGYIGSHTVLAALEAGLKPVVLDNLYSGFCKAVPEGVPFIKASILDSEALEKVFTEHKITSIMHFAAHLEVEESTREPLKYYENNVYGTLNLLRAAQKSGTVEHFVFSSTCATYGNPERVPVDESCAQKPVSPYGASKLATEMLIKDYAASLAAHSRAAYDKQVSMTYALLRYFNVAGADPKGRVGQSTPKATQLVKVCAEVAAGKREALTVFGTDYNTPDGTCVRDYIHVSDLAEAHILALKYLQDGGSSEAFNLGYGKGYSVLDISNAMKKASGVDYKIKLAPRRAGDPESIYSDTTHSNKLLGFKPKYEDIDLICKTSFNWEQNKKY